MKIKSLELSGFRAFARQASFDLDADAVIISGSNGRGKTSLFDAVLWGITGQVPRLGTPKELISLYSETGEARVRVDLSGSGDEGSFGIIRACDRSGNVRTRVVQEDGSSHTGPEAESIINRRLWSSAVASSAAAEAATRTFTRSIYLEQDLLRQYLEADSDDERFGIISELVGVGRITELQQSISREKRAWTKGTTPLKGEADEWERRIRDLERELERLGEPDKSPAPPPWEEWWARVTRVTAIEKAPGNASPEVGTHLERALDQLETNQRDLERRLARLRGIGDELDGLPQIPEVTPEEAGRRVVALEEELSAAEAELSEAQERARNERARLVAEKERKEDLAALARLALRHLGDTCPVCTQGYDEEHTRNHLRALMESATAVPTSGDEAESTPDASERVSDLTGRLERARRDREGAERANRRRVEAMEVIRGRLEDLSYTGPIEDEDALSGWLESESAAVRKSLAEISDLSHEGEVLSLTLARYSEQARREELEGQLHEAKTKYGEIRSRLERREKTGETCEQIVDALRNGEHGLVAQEIRRLEPLLKHLYAKIDPHPTFQDVALAVTMYYGKGRLNAELVDNQLEERVDDPRKVLSSSQMNAFAVCLFLAMNYGTVNLPLHAMLLDDPIQSLDDINLLGVIDLLRRIRPGRQVIVSTHDDGFARLLERKLRPVDDQQRTLSIEFLDWSRLGPEVAERAIAPQTQQLRVVA